ncbi:MAG: hypothetical protein ACRD2R_07910 [Terriglobales bacterium]
MQSNGPEFRAVAGDERTHLNRWYNARVSVPRRKENTLEAAALAALHAGGRALRRLGLEIAGFFFLVFAAVGGAAAWREYAALEHGSTPERLGLALGFSVLFAYFGATSFWRARRKA